MKNLNTCIQVSRTSQNFFKFSRMVALGLRLKYSKKANKLLQKASAP